MTKTAAEIYREKRAGQVRKIIEVVPPSKMVFKFYEFEVLSFLLNEGLPSNITAAVAEKSDKPVTATETEIVQKMLRLRDRIVANSVEPKLVLGDATAPNELSVGEVSDEDLSFLMAYFANGGVQSDPLKTFRTGQGSASGTRVNRKKRRVPAK